MPTHPARWLAILLLAGAALAPCAGDELGVTVSFAVPSPVVTVVPVGPVVVTEGGLQALVQVSLNTSPGIVPAVIAVGSSDPGEMTPSQSSLTFTSADWSQPQIILVTGVDDAIADGNQACTLVLGAIVGSYFDGIDPSDVAVVNQDDEVPAIVLTATGGGTTVTEGGAGDSYGVTLAVQPSGAVTVSLLPDSQLGLNAGTLTFTPADWNQAQTVSVAAIDDTRAQGNRTALIGHRATGGGYSSAPRVDLPVAVVDDDAAAILAAPASITVSELATSAQVRVSLRSRPNADVVLAVASNRTGEATVTPATLTFTSDSWAVEQVLTVTGVNDSAVDGSQPFVIGLTASGDPAYAALAPAQVFGINQDDDSANVLIRTNGALTVSEGGGTGASYAVRLTQAPSAPVTVVVAPDAQVAATPSSLVFTAANWNLEQAVAVGAIDDAAAEGSPHAGAISHTWSSADPGYNSAVSVVVSVGIVDNDAPSIEVAAAPGLATTETGATATFSVRLGSRPTGTVTVPLTTSDAGQGTVSPSVLSFDASTWSTPQPVVVTGADANARDDGDVAYAISVGPASGTDPFYAGLSGAPVSLVNRAVDQAPTLDALAPLTVAEDAGATVVALAGIGTGQAGENQTLTVTASSDNPALTGGVAVAYASPAASGGLTITPAANAHGSATITVAVSDGTTTTQRSFALTVSAVNDAPVVVRNTRLVVGYHGTGQIAPLASDALAPGQLVASDVETAAPALLARVVLAPNLGELRRIDPLTGVPTALAAGDAFALGDVALGLVRYTHTAGSGAINDAVGLAIEDGDGGSTAASYQIRIDPDVPAVDLLPAGLATWVEDAPALLIGDQSLVADQNSADFGSGRLEVALAANGQAGDVLEVLPEGTGAGQIGLGAGGTVSYGGAVIGTLSGGSGGSALTVTLTGNATPAATQALLRRVAFRSTSQAPSAATRTVRAVVTDDLGFASTPADRAIAVQPVNDAPALAALDLITVAGVPMPGQLVASDPDGPGLSFAVAVPPVKGALTAFDAATGAFTYLAASDQSGPDQFTIVASDGVASSAPMVATVAITGAATPARVVITSDPPLEAQAGDTLLFTARIAAGDLLAAPDLSWRVLDAPAGMAIVPDPATSSAAVSWTIPDDARDHVEFRLVAVDRVGRTAGVQWIAIYVHALPGGAQ